MVIYLLIHILLSSVSFFIGTKKINKQERFCNVSLSFFLPVIGLLMVLLLYYTKKESSKEIGETTDTNEVSSLFCNQPSTVKDSNIIPLEDALFINDTIIKRKQILDIAKGDVLPYIDSLKIALQDDDSETSHYAATAITNTKKILDAELQKKEVQYEKDKSNLLYINEYYNILDTYLNSKLLDSSEKKIKLFTYIKLLRKLIDINVKDEYYTKIVDAFYEMNMLDEMEKYSLEFLEKFQDENAYLSCLKYYYLIKNKKRFNEILLQLRNSKVKLSNGGINIVRFWLGDSNEK